MSYNGGLDFGLIGDADAMPDLDDVAACLDAALEELAQLAGIEHQRRDGPATAPGKPTRRRAAHSRQRARPPGNPG